MNIRPEIRRLVEMGPFPSSDDAEAEDLSRREAALKAIRPPVTQEEASELTRCFGPDEYFGLAWSLLHIIETAPARPILDQAIIDRSEWIRMVWLPRRQREQP